MNIKKTFATSLIVIFLVLVLLLIIFDKYEYEDYVVDNCEAGGINFDAQLIGSFLEDSPRKRGGPYYLRIKINNQSNVLPENLYFQSDNASRQYPFALSDRSSPDKNIFLIENINIPYRGYTLEGYFLLKDLNVSGEKVPFKCDVKRSPSSEYRITWIDNLLSV